MTDRHLIVGAGPVGRHLAHQLAERGSEVVVVTRSGTDTGIAGVQHLRLDASDREALSAAADGASVLYNCANPPDYTTWEKVWPPLASALLVAAERSGAVYAITGTLYPYGPVDGPITESLPDAATDHKGVLRAMMWADAKALHEAGRIRTLEVRGSDYVGTGVGVNGHVSRQVPGLLQGKRAWVLGRKDQPHTFTDVRDAARLLVAAAGDPSAHGRIWHVPSNAPRTQEQVLTDVMSAVGRPQGLGDAGTPDAGDGSVRPADAGDERDVLPVEAAVRAGRRRRALALLDGAHAVGRGVPPNRRGLTPGGVQVPIRDSISSRVSHPSDV
jgi:nucleoside-diphosphate-sugar epimerase